MVHHLRDAEIFFVHCLLEFYHPLFAMLLWISFAGWPQVPYMRCFSFSSCSLYSEILQTVRFVYLNGLHLVPTLEPSSGLGLTATPKHPLASWRSWRAFPSIGLGRVHLPRFYKFLFPFWKCEAVGVKQRGTLSWTSHYYVL